MNYLKSYSCDLAIDHTSDNLDRYKNGYTPHDDLYLSKSTIAVLRSTIFVTTEVK